MGVLDGPVSSAVNAALEALGGGETLTITRTVKSYLPETGKEVVDPATTYPVNAAPPEDIKADGSVSHDVIQQSVGKVFISAEGLEITPSHETDTITLLGKVWRIVYVQPLSAGHRIFGYYIYYGN